ncbi:MAG: alcohol dehydrogenase catalytic domain-containing protein [Bacilli bacterium]|jgi:L-iditol 2-dehydrogenase
MLAARMYGVNDVRIEKVERPKPSNGEVLIKVKSAAFCGTDIRMIAHGAKGINEEHPRILGHEFAGIIAEIGEDVTNYQIGDRVCFAPNIGCGHCLQCWRGDGHLCQEYRATGINLDGGFAEYVLIPKDAVNAGNICHISNKISFDEAAINEPFSCVFNGFEHAAIKPGDKVLIIGAGPIGIMHCLLALMAGGIVYLSDLSNSRLLDAKKKWPKINIVTEDLDELVAKETKGEGLDVVICACPSPTVQTKAIELMAIGGRVVFFGGIPKDKVPVPLDTNLIHYRQLIVTGTTRASLAQFRKTLDFLENGIIDLKPLVSKTYSLQEFNQALEQTKKGIGYKNIIRF